MPVRFSIARRDTRLCGAVVDIDESTGRARSITRIQVLSSPSEGAGGGDA
jgi:calcineurin-like phosphoesterase